MSDPLKTAINTGTREEWDRYIKWLQDGRPELRKPEDWCKIRGVQIMDPDGWRHDDAPAWDEPISEAEFVDRLSQCTIRRVD